MTASGRLGLFEGFGVELEYMLVDEKTLDILPVVDRLIEAAHGSITADHEDGPVGWANELVLHVMEFRNVDPVPSLDGLAEQFQTSVGHAHELAKTLGARLLPTGMHPWMDPASETRLWPHEYAEIYQAFDRIFNCRRHGWANLQSCQINLSFADDAEFARLHAAIRMLLPVMPALAASTPITGGRIQPFLDNRLEVYRTNSAIIPSVAGRCIPETAASEREYRETILQRIYRDIAPHDPDEILRDEWLNARGAIPRFQRSAIEIRILDAQECPAADLSICKLVTAVLRAMISGRWAPHEALSAWKLEDLESILIACRRDAGMTVIKDAPYLAAFGFKKSQMTAREFWQGLAEAAFPQATDRDRGDRAIIDVILKEGTLAERILKAVRGDERREHLHTIYRELADCLAAGRLFHA